MNESYLLSSILLIPLAGAIIIAFMRDDAKSLIKFLGIGFSVVAFIVSVLLFVKFDGVNPNMQFVEKYDWIPSLHVSYHLGVDGMSLLLVVLTTFLTPIAFLASCESI